MSDDLSARIDVFRRMIKIIIDDVVAMIKDFLS